MEQLIWLEMCGRHTSDDAYRHCSKLEVEAFAHWLENKKN